MAWAVCLCPFFSPLFPRIVPVRLLQSDLRSRSSILAGVAASFSLTSPSSSRNSHSFLSLFLASPSPLLTLMPLKSVLFYCSAMAIGHGHLFRNDALSSALRHLSSASCPFPESNALSVPSNACERAMFGVWAVHSGIPIAHHRSRSPLKDIESPRCVWQLKNAVDTVLSSLRRSVRLRVCCEGGRVHRTSETSQEAAAGGVPLALPAASVAILFSGGVDSTLLAALAHEVNVCPFLPSEVLSVGRVGTGRVKRRVMLREGREGVRGKQTLGTAESRQLKGDGGCFSHLAHRINPADGGAVLRHCQKVSPLIS